jgi:hypothetical protein
MANDLLTIQQSCDLLKVSRPTFARVRKDFALTEFKIGKRIRFSKREIQEKVSGQPSLGFELRQPKKNALSHNNFQLEEIWNENEAINLDDLGLIDAFTASSLLCLILARVQKGQTVEIYATTTEKASYLARLDFFNQVKRIGKNLVRVDAKLLEAPSHIHPEIILPISAVGFKGAERRYTSEIKSILKTHGFSEDIGHYIGWTLGELADNAHTHSNAHGMCFISIERLTGRQNFLQINIVDCGEGIPNTLRKNIRYKDLNDSRALIMAFKSKVSSWGDEHERGKGLTDLLKIVFECNSHFRVESGSGAYQFYCHATQAKVTAIEPSTRESGTRFSITLIDDGFTDIKREYVDAFVDEYLEK